MLSIKEQCFNLYMSAFKDDKEFTTYMFDTCFEDSCFYLLCGETVVSMLFAFDVFLNGVKGKYLYSVATDEKYRDKGYMSRLFYEVEEKLKGEYKFFCLRPMNESLFNFYEKLGFVKKFYKREINTGNIQISGTLITDVNDFLRVRKSFLKQNFVETGDKFGRLLLSYCDVYTDSIENPNFIIVRQKEDGKIKEVLGDLKIDKIVFGDEFCFAVYKSLGYHFDGNGYLGLAMD